jgi:GTP-binding protein
MAFVDETSVSVRGGRGGNGAATQHSEPYKPLGGPDGGNGGPGGSVIFEVSRRARDLSWLADHPHQRAVDGVGGQRAKRDGAAGEDLVVPVTQGTPV